MRKGLIIRIKKGLYIFGDEYRRSPVSREILANLMYGPSYISLEYALHYYGLIPERVETATSVTTGRSRRFSTPVGLFTYRMVPLEVFRVGMSKIEIGEGRAFIMAMPAKALADKLQEVRGIGIQSQRELKDYLEKNLRVDLAALKEMGLSELDVISQGYQSRRIRLLSDLVRRIHHEAEEERGHE